MNEKAEKLIELFTELIANHYNNEKSACQNTPLCSLSNNDLKVLCSLNGKDYPSIKEISEELSIPMSTLTGIFNKLVNRGFVERYRCKEDRRVVRINLTEKGIETTVLKYKNSHKFALGILESLDPKEQDQFLNLLSKIVL